MATVTNPTAAEVVARTGITTYLTGEGQSAFDTRIDGYVADVEAETAAAVGEAAFDGSGWTARQAKLLAKAISHRAGAAMLRWCVTQDVTGTGQPLLTSGPEDILGVAEAWEAMADGLERLAQSGTKTKPPFAMPTAEASTFTPSTSDRTPSERNALRDEREDVSAHDLDNG